MADTSKFFVDTSILIAHIRQQHPTIFHLGAAIYGVPLVSDIVVFEIETGAQRVGRNAEFPTHFPTLQTVPLTQEVLIKVAELQAKLISQNQAIGIIDIFIAATALYHDLPLLSLNIKHFARVENLTLLALPTR